jgi:carboxyl-terminal processing protease
MITTTKWRHSALILVLSATLLAVTPLYAYAGTANDSVVSSPINVSTAKDEVDLKVIQEVLDYLDTYNLEGIERKEFIEQAIRGMVYSLDDPYSDYFTKEELQEFKKGLNQQYVGIGATLRFIDGKLYITDVLPGSPAQAAGIKQGDIIVKINGDKINSPSDIMLLQGKDKSTATITVKRNGKTLAIPVKRSQFTLPSVRGSYLESGKIGYIVITSFTDTAEKEFTTVLKNLRTKGIKSIVLDLRDNPGGYVDAAADIAKHFIKNGTLMYAANQTNQYEQVLIQNGENIGMPVVVLTNESTASASEILTGALRDNGVATVVGSQTFGKARIQNLFSLSDGSSLKLTVERYLTPKQEDFNHIGLKPDIEVSNYGAQLITGMYTAGMRQIKVSGNAFSLHINDVAFPGFIDTISDGKRVYAPSRLLNSLIQGKISWNKDQQKLTVTDKKGNSSNFTKSAASLKVVNGETYIELHDFQKKFPSVTWSYQQGTLELSTKLR